MDLKERVSDSLLKGNCCSETVMNMFLEDIGRDPGQNRDLVKSMGAFCGGLHAGLACGVLCAAVSVLWIAEQDPVKAREEIGPEMMEWFKDRFGAWNCADLLEGDESWMMTLCPIIMEDTYIKVREMLQDMGY